MTQEDDKPVHDEVEKSRLRSTEFVPKTALDWDGDDDPSNPLNWSAAKRYYHLSVASLLSFAATYPASGFSPAIKEISEKFGISREVSILGISLYVLGLAFGPVVASGLSETFGRRPIYLCVTPIALLFTLGAGFSNSIGGVLVCRFLSGLFGAAPLAVGAGTVVDVSYPRYRATAIGIWVLSPFLGPALGPSTSSYACQYLGYRWWCYCSLIVGGICYILSLGQKETYKKAILKRRAKRYNLPPPHDPIPSGIDRVKFLLNVTVVRSSKMLLTEPIVGYFSAYVALNFSINFGFFAGIPYIYSTVYGFEVGASGLPFLSIGVGAVIATGLFVVIDRQMYVKKLLVSQGAAELPPEERLYSSMFGALLIPIGLFWFGWTARETIHWIVPTISLAFFGCGSLLVFDGCLIFLADVYGPLYGASANAGNNWLRYVTGAAMPLFIIQMMKGMSIPWAISLLGFLSALLALVPWILYKYGRTLRARSSFKTSTA